MVVWAFVEGVDLGSCVDADCGRRHCQVKDVKYSRSKGSEGRSDVMSVVGSKIGSYTGAPGITLPMPVDARSYCGPFKVKSRLAPSSAIKRSS